jgi:hypothetical protein
MPLWGARAGVPHFSLFILCEKSGEAKPGKTRSLHQFEPLIYADFTRGSASLKRMHRLTAKILLLFALAGTVVPLALAATAAPPHACCRRKAAHPCHESVFLESSQLAIRGTGCCSQDSGRAATTSQWANPQPGLASVFTANVDAQVTDSHPTTPASELSASQSTRAPPQISIA